MKDFKELSWQVSEEDYRADPALSYSTLAKYEREGFNNLNKLFDKVDTPSLTFGSAVDSIITGGEKEFNDRFIIAEFPSISDSIIKIVKAIFNDFNGINRTLESIDTKKLIKYTEMYSYQLNWKPETRVNNIKEKGSEYYNLLFISQDKTILNTETYQDVCNTVNALKNSVATKYYFMSDNPFENVKRYYQLKFKGTINGINYRCMADEIIVDYDSKIIIPIDLKTSSKPEWDFYKSFLEWRYDIQSRLYWAIIRQNMDKDEYFKDFKLLDYRFIVVNKNTLTPLVWECPFTQAQGDLKFGKYEQILMRSPFIIGEELDFYLKKNSKVPKGIFENANNDLRTWLNKI